MSQEYNADSIQVLSDIQHMRLRRGMYIGEAIDPRHLFVEVLDNAVDEAQSGYSKGTVVSINTSNNMYSIRDYGRGIPHGTKILENNEEKYVVEIICTKANSGGKFDGKSYTHSGGLHGLGLTITNALSNEFRISSFINGKSVNLEAVDSDIKKIYESDIDEPNGSIVSFIPNPDYFESAEVPIDFVVNKCKILNAFGYSTRLFIDDEEYDLSSSNSLITLMPEYEKSYMYDEITFEDGDELIRVALNYTNGTSCNISGYTNLIYNRVGGTHTKYINRAICDVWAKLAQAYPDEHTINLKYDDCTLGLDVLVAVFLREIEFSSQTKEKLTVKPAYLDNLMNGFKDKFLEYMVNHPDLRKALIKRFEEYRIAQNKLLSQKEITSIVKINESTDGKSVRRKSVVPGLIECTSTNKDGTELYIVEGKSAAGPVARARDKKFQSVLPLRGKIKNVTYMSIKDALKSQEVCNIVNAVGAGVGTDSDPSRSRYGKIIIATDADPDGSHIVALVLSVFVNIIPNVVKEGLVYILEAPLYGFDDPDTKKRMYTSNMNEVPSNPINFTRYKGLGEMDDSEFKDSCLVEGHRSLYQVIYPDSIDKFNEILGTSKGRSNLLKDLGIIKYIGSNDEEDYGESSSEE